MSRCVFCLVFCFSLGCSQDDPSRTGQFGLLDLDGKPVDLWKQTQNTITVVLFTRTDCPIANRCAPEFRELCDTYHATGIKFFLVYVDPRQQPADIRRHLEEFGFRCPALRDPKHHLAVHCQATTTPEAVVFDKDHNMVYRGRVNDMYVEVGLARAKPTTHDLADAIAASASGRPVATPRTKAIGCLIADLKE